MLSKAGEDLFADLLHNLHSQRKDVGGTILQFEISHLHMTLIKKQIIMSHYEAAFHEKSEKFAKYTQSNTCENERNSDELTEEI